MLKIHMTPKASRFPGQSPPKPWGSPFRREMDSGVYTITNSENGKVYIGSTVNFKQRWRVHKCDLRHNRHGNPHLQSSWNKYGEVAFKFVACEYVEDKEQLHIREQYWLDFHRTLTEVYNCGAAARNARIGYRYTEEEKREMSRTRAKGKDHHNWGKPCPPKTRRKISEAQSGERHWFYGRRHTEETKRKMSEASTGADHMAKPYPAFIHRETSEIIPAGFNLRALCRARGLIHQLMSNVKNGKQSHHHGWMLLEVDSAD